MSRPSISLIIPVYNRPDMIRTCLASLAPSLDDLHEVLIVDDGSTDGETPKAAREAIEALNAGSKLRLIEQVNTGPGAARNTGASEATGDWLAFFDSDDIWMPWTGQTLRDTIEKNSDVACIFFNVEPFDVPDTLDGFEDKDSRTFLCANFFELTRLRPVPVILGGGYFALPRSVFAQSGGFVPDMRSAEDTDLFYRLSPAGQFLAIQHPVLVGQRQSNEDSLTRDTSAVVKGVKFMLGRYHEGHYNDPTPDEAEQALADLLAFWLHDMFWHGFGKDAYSVLLSRGTLRILANRGHKKSALKLLFIPILALLRPKNHRFAWRPKPA